MTETDRGETGLAPFFDAARRDGGQISDALTRRMLADGLRQQRRAARARPVRARGDMRAGLRRLVDTLGGWPAMAGLAGVCALGVWLGLAPPVSLPDPVRLVGQAQADLDLFGGDDLALALSEEG